jgi:phage baseplate assembly protein W
MTVDYGLDLWCTDDLDPGGRTVTGAELMRQAILHHLTTPRGAILDAPNYGIDIRSFLSSGIDARPNSAQLLRVRAAIIGELLADERIQSFTVDVSYVLATKKLIVRIDGVSADGPFSLVLSADKVAAAILEAA